MTAATVAKHTCLSAYEVHTSIGGHDLAGVLSNGDRPTVLLRADMEALPMEEKTGLDSASKVTIKDDDGNTAPVAHACGHDMHVTCLMVAAEWLSSKEVKEQWNDTLVVYFQPNEERGKGASTMMDGGLYDKAPVPDVVLGQHVMPSRKAKVSGDGDCCYRQF